MSRNVIDFANEWVSEHIDADVYNPGQEVIDAHVARLIADAAAAGISQVQLEEEFGDLSQFIADEIDTATDNRIDLLADEDD